MKVRLTAEEYSIYASLCDRIPTRRAHLLRRGLRVPLACRAGDRPRNSVRLRRQAVRAAVACPGLRRARSGYSRAHAQACYAGFWHEGCTSSVATCCAGSCDEDCAARGRERTTAREIVASCKLGATRHEGAPSDPAARPYFHTPLSTSTEFAAATRTAAQSSAASRAYACGRRGTD